MSPLITMVFLGYVDCVKTACTGLTPSQKIMLLALL